jgi:hypothetical protein
MNLMAIGREAKKRLLAATIGALVAVLLPLRLGAAGGGERLAPQDAPAKTDAPKSDEPKTDGEGKPGRVVKTGDGKAAKTDKTEKSDDYDKAKDADKADNFGTAEARIGVTEEEAKQIGVAIDEGRKFLGAKQDADGMFPGFNIHHGVGGQALVLLTLIKCGMPREDPIIKKGHEALFKMYREAYFDKGKRDDRTRTYASGLILMYLEAYYTVHEEKPKDGKPAGGPDKPSGSRAPGEGGGVKDGKADNVKRIAPERRDLNWIKEVVQQLETTSTPDTGVWGYPENHQYGDVSADPANKSASNRVGIKVLGDLSNTQYALLGLKAASRMGVKVKNAKIYQTICDWLIKNQDADGPKVKRIVAGPGKNRRTAELRELNIYDRARGWTYVGYRNHIADPKKQQERTGTMNGAAIACLLIAKSELDEMGKVVKESDFDKNSTQAIWDGYTWFAKNFTVEYNPACYENCTKPNSNGTTWLYYYLYGLERAGMLGGADFFGVKEWYPPGARHLLTLLRPDHSWCARRAATEAVKGKTKGDDGKETEYDDTESNLHDTCFALLFLKKATQRVTRGPAITGEKRDAPK